MTLSEFIAEAVRYHGEKDNGHNEEHKFLKFVLAGRRGLALEDQCTITLNVTQGQADIRNVTMTRDYDSLIGTTKTLPYSVALTVWPIPSFRDTITANNHITSVAFNMQVGRSE